MRKEFASFNLLTDAELNKIMTSTKTISDVNKLIASNKINGFPKTAILHEKSNGNNVKCHQITFSDSPYVFKLSE